MILTVNIEEKSFGDKRLFDHAKFSLQDGEKVGLIGRNGEGKTTLFRILTGEDTDYQGQIEPRRGAVIVATRQEHHGYEDQTVMAYILADLPQYEELKEKIETLPLTMGDNMRKITQYSEALEQFEQLGYYTIEDEVGQVLESFQLGDVASRSLGGLSGGQKRLVEVAKIMLSRAHIALVDEPTNHMDYSAKQRFIDWMDAAKETVLVITHDRDVLAHVDRILELKDRQIVSYKGGYDAYLAQNAGSTSSQMNEYELTQRRIANMKAKVIEYQRFKEKARDPGTIQRFKRLEQRAREELAELELVEKPTFWIDKDSVGDMGLKVGQQYQKFKAKNIRLQAARAQDGHGRLLVDVQGISLGYDKPLFDPVSFQVREGEVVELRGPNGVGKTTLIRTILGATQSETLPAKVFAGSAEMGQKATVGVYEQEVSQELFDMPLQRAIEHIYLSQGLSVGDTKVRQLMSDYLFTVADMDTPVRALSGGQKARLQLIRMLAKNPSLLILDEPTNHLDLPSIEELEQALQAYQGAILYVSHDSYFRRVLAGTVVQLTWADNTPKHLRSL